MFASALLLVAAQQISIPLGKPPRQVERPRAPIEQAGPLWAQRCKDFDEWDKPGPPVRLHGNSYLVGTCGIAAILITGEEGHILIDSGTEAGAELVANNIRSLGFQLSDIKFLLHSHEHIDHVGGIARLQQLTGAQLVASSEAAKVFATGAPQPNDPQAGLHKPFPAARVDRTVEGGEIVRLGPLQLTAIATPGHTAGALSWQWTSCDGGVCRRIVYADSLSPISRDDYRFSNHPHYLAGYRAGLDRLAKAECDILLTPHPSASQMRERMSGKASLFDSNGCKAYAAAIGKRLDERLAKEAGK
ncbi:subclass B3 metallo-beta-lactamase [Sphingomonas xanthus]|uniref:Subclass B3 metallo-beta-lactamase n=1 Tax=Sphingomonas xanthus TaxID=2594473 RepID=A0A516IQU1_9SPHN|nr:subclass B3 metallo-beta-lactamase [Sphingomonas xanthus]QDP19273.1 subclass B3 metallo-beta-lactamase [Sphingomonas xanthus]